MMRTDVEHLARRLGHPCPPADEAFLVAFYDTAVAAALIHAGRRDPWKDAVIDQLVVAHILTAEHETNPRKALQDLLAYHCDVAVDPRVSEAAARLVEQARAEERAAILALIEAGLDRERETKAEAESRDARDTAAELSRLRHWSDVRLWNSAHEKLLKAVRARGTP